MPAHAYGRDNMNRGSLHIGEWLGEQEGEGEPWYDPMMKVIFREVKFAKICLSENCLANC
jgi:hypothetical protein